MTKSVIAGVFPYKDKLLNAIRRLKEAGLHGLEVKMPVPDHDILDAVDHKPTPVGLFTLVGGIAGMATGFLGPAWAHSHWGFTIGGKPVVSLPPFIVIMFELTILFGALSTLIGLFFLARLPRPLKFRADHLYDPRCSDDHYGLVVETPADKLELVRQILASEGAEVKA